MKNSNVYIIFSLKKGTTYADNSYLCTVENIIKKANYLKTKPTMSKKFVVGDRVKDEWISVLDTEKKKLEFTNHLASAKEFNDEQTARKQLKELQTTGYFTDLQIYLLDNNKAYKPDERDAFQS